MAEEAEDEMTQTVLARTRSWLRTGRGYGPLKTTSSSARARVQGDH